MRKRYFCIAVCCLVWAWLVCAPAQGEQEYELKDGKWVPVAPPKKGTAAGEVSLVRQEVAKGHGRRACRAAKRFLKKYPGNPGCEEVMHLYGQAEIVRGRLFQAYEKFEDQLARWPNGQYAERALLREYEIAEAFLAGRKRIVLGVLYMPAKGDGLMILSRIAEHAPGSALAEKALVRIADYHYHDRSYEKAAEAYDRFLALFASSTRAPYAMLQAARATYASFRGVRYDETPLLDARQRFRVFAERYPGEARKANVARTLRRIHLTLAEKTYRTGRFYERIGRKTAAMSYYRRTVKDFRETKWAQKARKDLRRLGHPILEQRAAPQTTRPGGAADRRGGGEKK